MSEDSTIGQCGDSSVAPRLTPEQALEAINRLRSNVIATQDAGWSNLVYPLVAILNAAGCEFEDPTDDDLYEHRGTYGGAGGWPRHLVDDWTPRDRNGNLRVTLPKRAVTKAVTSS